MKETLEQELVDLATEIIAYQGRLNLSELSQKAHKISEKITILGFVEKYYQMLRTSEQRMTYTLRKVANFIDEQENIFNIDVAFKELQPLEQPLIEETPAEKPAFVAMEPAPVQAAAEPIAEKVAEPTSEPTPEPARAEPAPAEPIHFATPPADPTPAPATVVTEPAPIAEPVPAEPVHFTTPPAEPTPAAEPAPAEPVHFATPPVETAPAPAEVVAEPAPAEVPDTTTDSVVEMTQFASPEAAITEPTAAQPVTNTSDEDLTSLYQDWNDWHSYTLPDDPPAEVAAPVSAPASEVAPAQTTVAAPVQAAPVAQAVAQPVENITPPTTINTQQPLREASTPDWAVSIEQPIVPPRPQQAETSHEPVHAAAPEQTPTSVVEQVLTAERLHPHQAVQPTAAAQAPVAQPVQSAQPENFIQQQHLTEEQQILRQTPSLEEFLAKSKATAFDKKDHTEEVKPTQSLNDRFSKEIQIGLNDKLAFIQKLFFGSESEYNRVLQHLNQLHSLEEAAQYIQQQVKPTYNNWKGKEEYEERFLHLILRRFE